MTDAQESTSDREESMPTTMTMPISWIAGGGILALAILAYAAYLDQRDGAQDRDSGALFIMWQWAAILAAFYLVCRCGSPSWGVWHYVGIYTCASVIASACFWGIDWSCPNRTKFVYKCPFGFEPRTDCQSK
jgi:hypothetical protein